jgi:hypothetical protein
MILHITSSLSLPSSNLRRMFGVVQLSLSLGDCRLVLVTVRLSLNSKSRRVRFLRTICHKMPRLSAVQPRTYNTSPMLVSRLITLSLVAPTLTASQVSDFFTKATLDLSPDSLLCILHDQAKCSNSSKAFPEAL